MKSGLALNSYFIGVAVNPKFDTPPLTSAANAIGTMHAKIILDLKLEPLKL